MIARILADIVSKDLPGLQAQSRTLLAMRIGLYHWSDTHTQGGELLYPVDEEEDFKPAPVSLHAVAL